MQRTIFTPVQKQFLKDNYLKMTHQQLADELGLTLSCITHKLSIMRLIKIAVYTEKEIEFVKNNYTTLGNKEIGEKIGRSSDSVKHQMKRLNLKRTKEQIYVLSKRLNSGNFVPFQKPHNRKKDFTIIQKKVNGFEYKFIKIADNLWFLYHRYLWEQKFGKIDENNIVVFKDGNTLNCDIENLECISKAENMLRNSKHNFPKEIIPSLVLVNKINKKIKSLENGTK